TEQSKLHFFVCFSCIIPLFHSNYAERRDKINTFKIKVRAVRAKPSSSSGYSPRHQAGIRLFRDYLPIAARGTAFPLQIRDRYYPVAARSPAVTGYFFEIVAPGAKFS
ncbi:MAG: hypothetical protein LBG22_09170, partial [Treponema sp.]|nr:hypothetical protein [Treponema sp.]